MRAQHTARIHNPRSLTGWKIFQEICRSGNTWIFLARLITPQELLKSLSVRLLYGQLADGWENPAPWAVGGCVGESGCDHYSCHRVIGGDGSLTGSGGGLENKKLLLEQRKAALPILVLEGGS
jgi:hypothetical protein